LIVSLLRQGVCFSQHTLSWGVHFSIYQIRNTVMPRKELERQVAQRTGEDIQEIRRLGFQVIDLTDPDFDPQPDYLSLIHI
jgi:hypothetical protein